MLRLLRRVSSPRYAADSGSPRAIKAASSGSETSISTALQLRAPAATAPCLGDRVRNWSRACAVVVSVRPITLELAVDKHALCDDPLSIRASERAIWHLRPFGVACWRSRLSRIPERKVIAAVSAVGICLKTPARGHGACHSVRVAARQCLEVIRILIVAANGINGALI
jgi:hypothetical protein